MLKLLKAVPFSDSNSAFRPAMGRDDAAGPAFNIDVPPEGYAWWYIDGISDDGKRAISIIGFIGTVYSP